MSEQGRWRTALVGDQSALWVTAVTLGVATLALAWPLLTSVYLPFADYPQHLGTIAAIHGQGNHDVSQYFVVDYFRSQYLVPYVLGDWLAYPFGVEGAGRATAVLFIATLPLAVGLYLREHGRPAILGAVSAGIALHVFVFWGFLNYSAGMVTGIVALAAMTRLHRAPDARNALLLAVAALACFYSHAQLFLWFGLACIVQTLFLAPAAGWKRSARVAGIASLAALPSVVAVYAWLHYSNVVEQGEAGSRSGLAAQVTDAPPSFSPIDELLRDWLSHSFASFSDHSGETIALEMLSLVLVLVALRGGSTAPSIAIATAPSIATLTSNRFARFLRYRAPLGAPLVSRAPEAVLALSFALYLFAPFSYRFIEPINHRFLPLALALLPALGPIAISARARWMVAVLSCALSIHVASIHVAHFAETDDEMGELTEVLEHTRPGHRLLGLVYDRQSAIVGVAPTYLHAHQYYQARVGGLACFSFVEFPKSPVLYRPGAEPPPFPPRFEWMPQSYDHHVYGDYFDYWLVRHEAHRTMPPPFHAPSPSGAPTPVLVFEADRWSLYARPELAQ